MAFNPFSHFQKNRRFWMATILMICMIVFVFCTGMKGDMGERILALFRPKGQTIARVGGYNVTREDLYDLREQRTLANSLMKRYADTAFKNVSKKFNDEYGKFVGDEQALARSKLLPHLHNMRLTLALRKMRPHYFEGGTKFDDLLEFKLWQVQADRMGIALEDDHVTELVIREVLGEITHQQLLEGQYEEARNLGSRRVNNAAVLRAVGEEFRVRMAQYAVMSAQPSALRRDPQKGDERRVQLKYSFAEWPDEVRAPLTPAQIWDYYQQKMSGFDVELIPVNVKDFIIAGKEMYPKDPSPIQQRDFFNANKNKVYDPASHEFGLDIPAKVKIEYLLADANSPAYLDKAKALHLVQAISPLAWNPMQSPVITAARYAGAAQADKLATLRYYESIGRQSDYRVAAPIGSPDVMSPLVAWNARRFPEAIASVMGKTYLSPLDPWASLSGYLAWGAVDGEADATPAEYRKRFRDQSNDLQVAERAEFERRAASYATFFASTTSCSPLCMASMYYAMDERAELPGHPQMFGRRAWEILHPPLPVEMVRSEMNDILAHRKAEEWAHISMRLIREKLDKDGGNDPAKFKRVLDEWVPKLNLTYGPPEAMRERYFDRFAITRAEEFKPLDVAFKKYIDLINQFEGRDLKPETLLKPTDFSKMFFDSSSSFAATSLYRAMPWPPDVMANTVRSWKDPDPRLINRSNITPAQKEEFKRFLLQVDPNQQAPVFDQLFQTAEKPILFWRTGYLEPQRPADFDRIDKDMRKAAEDVQSFDKELAQLGKKDNVKRRELKAKREKALQNQEDLKEIQQRIIDGWKFETARDEKALPTAKKIAETLVAKGIDPARIKMDAARRDPGFDEQFQKALKDAKDAKKSDIEEQVKKRLDQDKKADPAKIREELYSELSFDVEKEVANRLAANRIVVLRNVSPLQREIADYLPYKLPQGPADEPRIDTPRDDTAQQLVNLYDLKQPFEAGYPDLDKINKELFSEVKKVKEKDLRGKYVQIVTNRSRSSFYVAVVTAPPKADMREFVFAGLLNGSFASVAQQNEARQMREAVVNDLRGVLGYSVEEAAAEVRKSFDDKSSGD